VITAGSYTRSLLPHKQRMRLAQEQLEALKAELRTQQGIPVITCCTCGHEACGSPLPASLPANAWVVHLGCRLEVPEQVTAAAIDEQVELSTPLTPKQVADHQALLELAKQAQPTFIPIRR